MSSRDTFLRRVRQAVDEGNRAGDVRPLPERGVVGYQGAGADPVRRFCAELTAAGGHPHLAPDRASAGAIVTELVRRRGAQKAIVSGCDLVERLGIAACLRATGVQTTQADTLPAASARATLFAADVGISGVYCLVAETGTVVMVTSPQQPRSISLLPPVHIALAEPAQILPDLFDLFDLYSPVPSTTKSLPPSCLTLITGPSKTGDIELRLVTGVHGPGEIHVVLCTGPV